MEIMRRPGLAWDDLHYLHLSSFIAHAEVRAHGALPYQQAAGGVLGQKTGSCFALSVLGTIPV